MNEVLLNSRNEKFIINTYLGREVFNSFYRYGQHFKGELQQSFGSIISDWPFVINLIENLNQNYLNTFLRRLSNLVEMISNKLKEKYNLLLGEMEIMKEYTIELFNIIYESFEDKFARLRKYLFKSYNQMQSILNRQFNLLKSYLPDNYWNLIANLWSLLTSTEFWQSRFPIITTNLISFYF